MKSLEYNGSDKLEIRKAIAYLETLKPAGRTVQEIRDWAQKQSDEDFGEAAACYQSVVDFIDSGGKKDGDVCVWKDANDPELDVYSNSCCGELWVYRNYTYCPDCGRKIKRERNRYDRI